MEKSNAKSIDSKYLKNKNVVFYKAYILKPGDKMDLYLDGDIFYLDEPESIRWLIRNRCMDEIRLSEGGNSDFVGNKKELEKEYTNQKIQMLVIKIPKDDLDLENILTNKDGSVTIKMNKYHDRTIKLVEYNIDSIEIDIDNEPKKYKTSDFVDVVNMTYTTTEDGVSITKF